MRASSPPLYTSWIPSYFQQGQNPEPDLELGVGEPEIDRQAQNASPKNISTNRNLTNDAAISTGHDRIAPQFSTSEIRARASYSAIAGKKSQDTLKNSQKVAANSGFADESVKFTAATLTGVAGLALLVTFISRYVTPNEIMYGGSNNQTTPQSPGVPGTATQSQSTSSSQFPIVSPTVNMNSFAALMIAAPFIAGPLTNFGESVIRRFVPFFGKPELGQLDKDLKNFKEEILSKDLPPQIHSRITEEFGRWEKKIAGKILIPKDLQSLDVFSDNFKKTQGVISAIADMYAGEKLESIKIPSLLKADNPSLLKGVTDWEKFKIENLSADADPIKKMSPARQADLEKAKQQVDIAFADLINENIKAPGMNVSAALQKIHAQNQRIKGLFLDWERIKEKKLSSSVIDTFPQGVKNLIAYKTGKLEEHLDAMNNEDKDSRVFDTEIKKAERTLDYILNCYTGKNTFVGHIPNFLAEKNPILVKDFIQWEKFKEEKLSDRLEDIKRISPARKAYLDEAKKQLDKQFEALLYNGGPSANLAPELEKIRLKIEGMEKAFLAWEEFKKDKISETALAEYPDAIKKFICYQVEKLDMEMNSKAIDDPKPLLEILDKAKNIIHYSKDCYLDPQTSGKKIQKLIGLENAILVRNFISWERYKENAISDAVLEKRPEKTRKQLKQAIAFTDKDFEDLLYEKDARVDLRKALLQINLKTKKMDKYLLQGDFPLEEVKGWKPDWNQAWTQPEAAEKKRGHDLNLRTLLSAIDKMTDEYKGDDDTLDIHLNKDLLNAFFFLDMAKASKHQEYPKNKEKIAAKDRNWTLEEDWHVWSQKPVVANLIYWLYGPPGTGKGRLNKIIDFLKRTFIDIEIPNILQGGVASLGSQKWDPMLQFDIPSSDKDDVGELILQMESAGIQNPLWKINEPDGSDPEGTKKLLEQFRNKLTADALKVETAAHPSTLVFSNWIPLETSAQKGLPALWNMELAARDRPTMVVLGKSSKKTAEQDVIDAYRGWAYYLCTPFDNGAPANLTVDEQKRMQEIFKKYAYEKIIKKHRKVFDGTRMHMHVSAVMAKIAQELIMARPEYPESKPFDETKIKDWVAEYYARYEEKSYEKLLAKREKNKASSSSDSFTSDSEAESGIESPQIKETNRFRRYAQRLEDNLPGMSVMDLRKTTSKLRKILRTTKQNNSSAV